jgi:hypothetical protein
VGELSLAIGLKSLSSRFEKVSSGFFNMGMRWQRVKSASISCCEAFCGLSEMLKKNDNWLLINVAK